MCSKINTLGVKKILFSLFTFISTFSSVLAGNNGPEINCEGLPGCDTKGTGYYRKSWF
ncbi:MAG: hypothetical protein Q9M97_03670 [Candidatus Gracilibacteria bacterium]|nr:hypothetical protein [Candidatus Gracilibacteria bacterium]